LSSGGLADVQGSLQHLVVFAEATAQHQGVQSMQHGLHLLGLKRESGKKIGTEMCILGVHVEKERDKINII